MVPNCADHDWSERPPKCKQCRKGYGKVAEDECALCDDPNCFQCDGDPATCQGCRSGFTFVRKPPSPEDEPPMTIDADGWAVEEEVAKEEWPQVCTRCSIGCQVCDDPSPASCRVCFPMYKMGPEGCGQDSKANLVLAGLACMVFAIAFWITRSNWKKYQRIRDKNRRRAG